MIVAGCLLLTGGLAVGGLAVGSMQQSSSRQQLVADSGADVMPFDQAVTTHSFTDTIDGGYETVRANDPGDIAQVELIRGHLREIASASAGGRITFSSTDPALVGALHDWFAAQTSDHHMSD